MRLEPPETEPITIKRKKFLEYKHHKFLMESREQADLEWVKTNKELEEKAWAGEDEAFFQLLERNPEFLKTNLAMARIMEWRYVIERQRPFNRTKETYRTSRQQLNQIQKRIDNASENLLRIGKILAFEEGRGKRRKRYGYHLFDIYYTHRGLVSLFRGIKRLWRIKKVTEEDFYNYIIEFIEKFEAANLDRFVPIYDAIDALRSTKKGLSKETIQNILGDIPSAYARVVTAQIFKVSENTVRQSLKKFTRGGRDEVFEYLSYSNLFLGRKEPTYFKFLIPMIEFEKLAGIDIE